MTTAGHGEHERQRVLEVPERGAEAAEQARQHQRHPQLLRRRRELDRLDPSGTSAGCRVTAAIRRPGRGRERRQLAEEVEHVGLVAGAPAAERRPRRRRRAASRQLPPDALDRVRDRRPSEYARARSSPSARSSSRRADGLLDPGGDRGDVERVDEHGRAAGDLLGRAAAARHHRRRRRPSPRARGSRTPRRATGRRARARRGRARRAPRRTPRRPSPASRPRPSRARRRRAARRRPGQRPRRRAGGSSAARASRPRARSRRRRHGVTRREDGIDRVPDHASPSPRRRRAARPPRAW